MRFGNVLGSRGSFLHSLSTQVARGQQVTITDPEVTRYFMTIPEAAGLVIEAAMLARAGETYVLDMGTPVRILDLVERYLRLTGVPATGITVTGLRPGEKLHETLFDAAETGAPTGHPRISCVRPRPEHARAALARLPRLVEALGRDRPEQLRTRLGGLLPDRPAAADVAAGTAADADVALPGRELAAV